MIDDYSDIIDKERPKNTMHSPLSRVSRAAQFSPFSALTGYEEEIAEENRLTYDERYLFEDEKEDINRCLCCLKPNDLIEITHYIKDTKKKGGSHKTTKARVLKINFDKGELLLESGYSIPFENIYKLIRLYSCDI